MDMAEKTRRSLTVLRQCQEADREELNHWIRRYSNTEDAKKGPVVATARPLDSSVGAEGSQLGACPGGITGAGGALQGRQGPRLAPPLWHYSKIQPKSFPGKGGAFSALRKDTPRTTRSPDLGKMTTETERSPGQAQVPAESKVLQSILFADIALPHTSSGYRVSTQGHVAGPPPRARTMSPLPS